MPGVPNLPTVNTQYSTTVESHKVPVIETKETIIEPEIKKQETIIQSNECVPTSEVIVNSNLTKKEVESMIDNAVTRLQLNIEKMVDERLNELKNYIDSKITIVNKSQEI